MSIEKIDNDFLKYISKFGNTISFCRVGSSICQNTNKDVDYLWIVEDKENAKKVISNLEKIENIEFLDDSVRFLYANITCNIAIYNVLDMDKKIEQIINGDILGEIREWVFGYWLPEGLLYDIRKSYIIIDNEGWLEKKKEYIVQNMENFRKKIICRLIKEIDYCCKFPEHHQFAFVMRGRLILTMLRLYNISNNWEEISFQKIYDRVEKSIYYRKFKILLDINNTYPPNIIPELLNQINEIY